MLLERLFGKKREVEFTITESATSPSPEQVEGLVSALHGLLFLHFHHWPLTADDVAVGFMKNTVAPILPLVEAYHEALHGGPVAMTQATAADRARWMQQ